MPKISSIHWTVLVELRLVTDRQTDRQTQTQGHGIYRASIASRGNKMFTLRNNIIGLASLASIGLSVERNFVVDTSVTAKFYRTTHMRCVCIAWYMYMAVTSRWPIEMAKRIELIFGTETTPSACLTPYLKGILSSVSEINWFFSTLTWRGAVCRHKSNTCTLLGRPMHKMWSI